MAQDSTSRAANGTNPTSEQVKAMSALGQKRRPGTCRPMSGLLLTADLSTPTKYTSVDPIPNRLVIAGAFLGALRSRYTHAHPPPRPQCRTRKLAGLLRRCSCRDDQPGIRQPGRERSFNGVAASIPDHARANAPPAQPRHSIKRASRSRPHGRCFCPSGPIAIPRGRDKSGIRRRGSMRHGRREGASPVNERCSS